MKWSGSQWNCYNAVRSGLIVHGDEPLRFLTLTSVVDMNRSISDCFKILVNRIERLYPMKFVELGIIDRRKLSYYFPDLDIYDKLRFDYLYVLTSEGVNGVLHVLFYGDYVNERWLKDAWEDITGGARQLIIEKVSGVPDERKELSRYVVNQVDVFSYVAGQSKYVRHCYSKDWIYKGWRKDFNLLRIFCDKEKYPKSVFVDFWFEWRKWIAVGRFRFNNMIQLYIDSFE